MISLSWPYVIFLLLQLVPFLLFFLYLIFFFEYSIKAKRNNRTQAKPSGKILLVYTSYLICFAAMVVIYMHNKEKANEEESSPFDSEQAEYYLPVIYQKQIAYFRENKVYADSFEKLKWKPDFSLYCFYLGRDMVTANEPNYDEVDRTVCPQPDNWPFSIRPEIKDKKFIAMAVGNSDRDGLPDVWMIDERGKLKNPLSDYHNSYTGSGFRIKDKSYREKVNYNPHGYLWFLFKTNILHNLFFVALFYLLFYPVAFIWICRRIQLDFRRVRSELKAQQS